MKELEHLGRHVLELTGGASNLATGVPIAGNETLANWIRHAGHYNWRFGISRRHRARRWRARGHDDVELHSGEILGHLRNAVAVAVSVAPLDNNILALNVALLAQALDQGLIEVSAQPRFCERDYTNMNRLFGCL